MATFEGTAKSFKLYFGPFFRVIVQQITKKYKATIGACEHCGNISGLESAHIHGRNRLKIIDELLGTSEPNKEVQVELKKFTEAFKRAHEPAEKAILVLCSRCHRDYDIKVPHARIHSKRASVTILEQNPAEQTGDVLPILLDPPRPEEFKAKLLDRREAIIEVHYVNGNIDRRSWNAHLFSETSNVVGNLRSRPEFRKGRWQECGIKRLIVRVVE